MKMRIEIREKELRGLLKDYIEEETGMDVDAGDLVITQNGLDDQAEYVVTYKGKTDTYPE